METMRLTHLRSWAPGALLLTIACGGGSSPAPANGPAPEADAEVATSLVIDQFLRAANSNDLDTMARLFGTRSGSILKRDPKEQVDKQMFALASLLRHDSYEIVRREIVPGRREEATQLVVRMKVGSRQSDVPYTLVYSTDRSWMVEIIDLKALTRG
jgi:hypothetical protein